MRLVVSDYRCPHHGIFTATVERDANGDPPSEAKCMEWLTQEETEANGFQWTGHSSLYCGVWSPWTPTCARIKRPMVLDVHRGKSDPPPSPLYLDTEALADGMEPAEFDGKRAKVWEDHREREIAKAVS